MIQIKPATHESRARDKKRRRYILSIGQQFNEKQKRSSMQYIPVTTNRRLYAVVSAVYGVFRSCKAIDSKIVWVRFCDRVQELALIWMTETEKTKWIKKVGGGK